MANVPVLHYSAYGHIEQMAEAIAEGAPSVPGADVTIKRVPENQPVPGPEGRVSRNWRSVLHST